jgi:hypothetical protein
LQSAGWDDSDDEVVVAEEIAQTSAKFIFSGSTFVALELSPRHPRPLYPPAHLSLAD